MTKKAVKDDKARNTYGYGELLARDVEPSYFDIFAQEEKAAVSLRHVYLEVCGAALYIQCIEQDLFSIKRLFRRGSTYYLIDLSKEPFKSKLECFDKEGQLLSSQLHCDESLRRIIEASYLAKNQCQFLGKEHNIYKQIAKICQKADVTALRQYWGSVSLLDDAWISDSCTIIDSTFIKLIQGKQYSLLGDICSDEQVEQWLALFLMKLIGSGCNLSRLQRLIPDAEHLISCIGPKVLNHVIQQGKYRGEFVALCLARIPKGRSLLCANNYRLGHQLSQTTLNHVIQKGPNQGESVAFWLAGTPEGLNLFCANNDRLGYKLSQTTLNHVIQKGRFKGGSVAFWLAGTPEGRALLCANNYRLGYQLSQATLNHVVQEGQLKGGSVAFWLAGTPEGRALLCANNDRLGHQLSQTTLNHVIQEGKYKGESVVFWLTHTSKGVRLQQRGRDGAPKRPKRLGLFSVGNNQPLDTTGGVDSELERNGDKFRC